SESSGGAADDGGSGGEPAGCSGFACADGQCIENSWHCDQIVDCSSGEDEVDCPGADDDGGGVDPSGGGCNGFACDNGTCIEAGWQCDGYDDCSGAEDELGCGGASGDEGGGDDGGSGCDGFTCDDGSCIDWSWSCDGYVDCAGGEDESGCATVGGGLGLSAQTQAKPDQLGCIVDWTLGGGATGVVAGEVISKSCTAGGVVVGFVSGGGGFAAATVCFAADTVQLDAVLGGITGALTGLVGGVFSCSGDDRATADAALETMAQQGAIPTYEVEAAPATNAKKCGVPTVVPLTGEAQQCTELHDDMKAFETSNAYACNLDIGNIANDAASIAAACDEIRARFDNAATLADKRLAIGEACYDNGYLGPMGNSDYGHQVAWCSVHGAMQKCVEQARHAKLNCELTQTMAQHFPPTGCSDLLACN
ncbi:MAG: hypothetical protein IAG13_08525, partial [Deltaproteobacteria bacterium]|nr:hypothetical protein [Nannocystaceae bacterium]